jgi:hypothetical protein
VAASARITTELALRSTAATQRGLFTSVQAADHGWSKQRLHRWLRAGRVLRVHPRVYRFAGSSDDWLTDLLAAVLAAGEGGVASHRSAMAMHVIEPAYRARPTPIEISVPAGRDAKVRGAIVHRVILTDADVTVVDGIPCTAYERTLLDSAARLGLGQLARGLDQGLVTNRATLPSVDATIDRLRPAPGRRRARLRHLVGERAPESHRADSTPEIALLAAVRAAGLPDPAPQFGVDIDGEHFDLDAAYPDLRVGIEYLGWDPHRTRSKFDADHRRDRLLTLAGWSVLYVTSATSAAELVEHVTRLRAQSRKG